MMGRIVQEFLTLLIILFVQVRFSGETKRCLFIGDSYFSHNDLSKELLAVWNEEISDTLIVTNHNRNGSTIVSQWRYNSSDLIPLIKSVKWDYVIIELPELARPLDSNLVKILYEVDSLLNNCRIICLTMDFCYNFPEMACTRDAIEGVICNEFLNCKEKLVHVRAISEIITSHKYKNSIQVIPFAHYKHFLYDQYAIELGSDDEYGHPSSFSQSILARFILFHLRNKTNEVNDIQSKSVSSEAIHISSFYTTFYNEYDK